MDLMVSIVGRWIEDGRLSLNHSHIARPKVTMQQRWAQRWRIQAIKKPQKVLSIYEGSHPELGNPWNNGKASKAVTWIRYQLF